MREPEMPVATCGDAAARSVLLSSRCATGRGQIAGAAVTEAQKIRESPTGFDLLSNGRR
jgi:hypothetical protein